jgi:hypothetical protein
MPAIFMSFAFEPDDTVEQRMSKLYLGIISTGEQLYTYNAAIAELRKTIASADEELKRMKQQYEELKLQVRGTNSAKQLASAVCCTGGKFGSCRDSRDVALCAACEESTSSDTEVLSCGCKVMKGWRCPVHSAP